jgi:hypothetical protein
LARIADPKTALISNRLLGKNFTCHSQALRKPYIYNLCLRQSSHCTIRFDSSVFKSRPGSAQTTLLSLFPGDARDLDNKCGPSNISLVVNNPLPTSYLLNLDLVSFPQRCTIPWRFEMVGSKCIAASTVPVDPSNDDKANVFCVWARVMIGVRNSHLTP